MSIGRWLLPAILIFASACGGAAEADRPETTVAAAGGERPEDTTGASRDADAPALFLWEVRSAEGQTSHLLGTMHLGARLDQALPGEHAESLDAARLVFVEIDMRTVNPMEMVAASTLPTGESLSGLLGEERFAALVEAVPGVPPVALERMRPWVAMTLLVAARMAEDHQAAFGDDAPAPTASVDLELLGRVGERDTPVRSLESVAEQVAMLDGIPLESILGSIDQLLAAGSGESTVELMRRAYLDGDLAAVEAVVFDPHWTGEAPEVFEALYFSRNARWVDELVDELSVGGVFVAVGLGHLIGPRGVPAMLEERGFSVRRVPR